MKHFNLKIPLKSNIFVLRVGGLWPDGLRYHIKSTYSIYGLMCYILLVVLLNLSQVINIYFIYNQLEKLTHSTVVMLTEVTAMIKFYLFFKKIGIVRRLMEILDCDLFQPKNMKQKKILEGSFGNWKKMHMIYSTSAGTTLLLWALYPIIDNSYKDKNLPYIAWFPYDYKKSPYYEITYLYQIIANSFIAFVNVNVDAFISALMMNIASQCELLCDNLRNLDIDYDLTHCLKHHLLILRFAENTDQFISDITFGQFVTSVIAICVTMFQLTLISPSSAEFYTLFSYQSAIFTQVFIYCWFGNEVILKSYNIPLSVYESAWIDSSISFKKNLVFFIMRCQNPIKLRAINFFTLSLETFSAILRTSWSYFALLRQFNDN